MKLWVRNFIFLGLCLAATILKRPQFAEPKSFDPEAFRAEEFHRAVERVDLAFAADWKEKRLKPAAMASDLAVARRLSLALTGTIPSLEEVRAFESFEAESRRERIQWIFLHFCWRFWCLS